MNITIYNATIDQVTECNEQVGDRGGAFHRRIGRL